MNIPSIVLIMIITEIIFLILIHNKFDKEFYNM